MYSFNFKNSIPFHSWRSLQLTNQLVSMFKTCSFHHLALGIVLSDLLSGGAKVNFQELESLKHFSLIKAESSQLKIVSSISTAKCVRSPAAKPATTKDPKCSTVS